jgi:hypothetical protein
MCSLHSGDLSCSELLPPAMSLQTRDGQITSCERTHQIALRRDMNVTVDARSTTSLGERDAY